MCHAAASSRMATSSAPVRSARNSRVSPADVPSDQLGGAAPPPRRKQRRCCSGNCCLSLTLFLIIVLAAQRFKSARAQAFARDTTTQRGTQVGARIGSLLSPTVCARGRARHPMPVHRLAAVPTVYVRGRADGDVAQLANAP